MFVPQVELDSLVTDEQLANCPVLILGNKIDRPDAASEDELRYISRAVAANLAMAANLDVTATLFVAANLAVAGS